jgi:hypothetical protein
LFSNLLLNGKRSKVTDSSKQFPPPPSGKISQELIDFTFRQIKADVKTITETRLEYMKNTADLAPLIIHPRIGARRKRQLKE